MTAPATVDKEQPDAGAVGAFVVVCDARSGSGYLCSGLDRHPALACHHELFNPDFPGNQYGIEPFARSGQTDPLAYLDAIRTRTRARSGARLVGFKLHFRHHPGVLEHVLGDPGQRLILLCRRDKLAQWGSYQLARATGQWNLPENPTDTHSVPRVRFHFRRFLAYLVHQLGWERMVLRRRPDSLRIDYEDIVPPGSLTPVLRYLKVDPRVDVSPSSRRQFTGDSTLDRFANRRWAAIGAPIAAALARGLALLGLTGPVRRLTSY